MKGNPRVNLRNPSRHRFCDQKNKLQVPQASKPNNSKTIVTRAQARQRRSPSNSTRNDSVQSLPHSPKAEVVKPVELRFLPFSKSEEDTRAEHDDQSDSILSREPCWQGYLGQYRSEIMEYVHRRENAFQLQGNYMAHNLKFSLKARTSLVRHMFRVSQRFGLMQTTLHMAVLYMDMFLSKNTVLKDSIEGINIAQACLYIAMKYEQYEATPLSEWVDRKFHMDVLKMEAKILATLNFQLAHYSLLNFMELQMWEEGKEVRENSRLAMLADLTLFDMSIREKAGSQVAAAIISLVKGEKNANNMIELAVKWMIERQTENLEWLSQQKYGSFDSSKLF